MGNLYYQVIRVTDFGPYVTKLVLCMPRETAAEELKPEAFSVYVEVLGKDGRIVELPKSFIERDQFIPSRGYRPVTAAYPSDLHGNAVTGKSRFVGPSARGTTRWTGWCSIRLPENSIHRRHVS